MANDLDKLPEYAETTEEWRKRPKVLCAFCFAVTSNRSTEQPSFCSEKCYDDAQPPPVFIPRGHIK